MKFVAMMEMEWNHLARETMVQDGGWGKGPPPLRGGPSDKLPKRMSNAGGSSHTRFAYPRCLVVFELRHIFQSFLGRAA